jgi:DNA (cytosine-5)-methyltransferase 1
VIENVHGAPLRTTVVLCGSSFGLRVRRHRLFESNVLIMGLPCRHREQGISVGVYGNQGSGALRPRENGGPFVRAKNAADAGDAMGIDWMTWRELTQAIPPAYTLHIGRQLMAALAYRGAA